MDKLMKFTDKVTKHPCFVVSSALYMLVDIVLDILSVINYHTLFTQVDTLHNNLLFK